MTSCVLRCPIFIVLYSSIASDGLKGRVYEVSLADLQNEQDAERSFKKFKLICEEVREQNPFLLVAPS